MNVPCGPMFRAMRRHRVSVAILMMEVAVACAVLSNAIVVVSSRFALFRTESGLDERRTGYVNVMVDQEHASASASLQFARDLQGKAGIAQAAIVSALPYAGVSMSDSISTVRDTRGINVGEYLLSPGGLETLGLRIKAGRAFNADEYANLGADGSLNVASVIITETLARRLFGDESPLGQSVYVSKQPMTVVGVIDRLLQPRPSSSPKSEYSMILPVNVASAPQLSSPFFVFRCHPEGCKDAITFVQAKIGASILRPAVNDASTIHEAKEQYFSRYNDTITLVTASSVALLAITAFGFFGLGSYWVEQRTRQIGIRRALGATQNDILAYFHIENLAIVLVGAVFGVVLAFLVNDWLMQSYELERLPLAFIPIAIISVVTVGQLAILRPAIRAMRIDPVEAIRDAT